MSRFFLFFGLCFYSFNVFGVEVTFSLNMPISAASPNGIHIAGSFGDPNNDGIQDNLLPSWVPSGVELASDGNGLWSVTLDLIPSSYNYKFINGNDWFFGENVICSGLANGERTVVIGEENQVLPTVCFNQCTNCILSGVTFQVDMSNQTVSPNGVHLAGSFADANSDGTIDNPYPNWNPGGIALTNAGNGIWSVTLDLAAGSYEYKFVNGSDWSNPEFFSAGAPCVQGSFGNRLITVGSVNQTLPLVCWNECVSCDLIGTGCLDASACNYDPNATIEGPCVYPDIIPEIIVEPFGGNCYNNGMNIYPSAGNFIQYSWGYGGSVNNPNPFSSDDTLVWYSQNNLFFIATDVEGCEFVIGPFAVSNIPTPNVLMCMVTVNEITGKNQIVWDPFPSDVHETVVVYKESNVQGVYEEIGTVPYSGVGVFEDLNSNPIIQANRYGIGTRDSCGQESPSFTGINHKTIHLTANQGIGNNINLIWNAYEANTIEGPMLISSYNIYRGTNANSLNLIATVAGNVLSYTDIAPPVSESLYVIEVAGLGCDPSREMMSSRSNVMNLLAANISEETNSTLQIFPNPASTQITFKVDESDLGASIVIFNALGQEVLADRLNAVNQTLNIEKLSEGFYFVKVEGRVVRLQIVK